MLKTVKDACTLHESTLEYQVSGGVENLLQIIHSSDKGRDFFARSYMTAGMEDLLAQGLLRLAGQSGQAVYELAQAMGGGKSHLMAALGLTAKYPDLRSSVVPLDVLERLDGQPARVAVFDGRNSPDHYLWGELAEQLGQADAVNYHEITEFFIAWLRKNPPPPFDEWTWDSRRALAIKGAGDEFRKSMVEAYQAMTENMPDNGLQCVMFTHQDPGVWSEMVSIFWAAGLRVVGAWYIATETSSALKSGGHVQGTVTLVLRKRLEDKSSFKQRLLPKIRKEVQNQIDSMMRLNEEARGHGEAVFNDSDLQMAGYAAALKVLTNYSEVDGRDVTRLAMQPRQKGKRTVIDDIVEFSSEIANNLLIPERLKEINPETWEKITGLERFYLRMLAIEQTGMFKLDNYQNFAKAFHVDYTPLMASVKPNSSKLKGAMDFNPRELAGGDTGNTLLGEVLLAVQELMNDKEPKTVMAQMRASLDDKYFQHRPHLMAMAQYIHDMLISRRLEEAKKAEIIANRIRNEGI